MPSHVALALGVIVTVSAETAPPPLPFADWSWTAKVGTQPAANLTMGPFRVTLEMTTLDEVRAAVGGEIHGRGDAAGGLRWLCYRLDGRSTHQRLWLQSGGETPGRARLITGITATLMPERADPRATRDCPPIPVTLLPVSFDNGVWLGTPEATVVAKFGAPPGTLGSWSGYRYSRKGDGSCQPGGFDVLNSLQWQSSRGVIDTLNAVQASRC